MAGGASCGTKESLQTHSGPQLWRERRGDARQLHPWICARYLVPMSDSAARTPATDDFRTLIGTIIHHCGALELLTNGALAALSRDPLLVEEATQLPLGSRVRILRRLLHGRAGLPPSEVDGLCDALSAIAKRRNEVAHNPIMTSEPASGTERIVVVRHASTGASIRKEISRDELRSLVNLSRETLETFVRLVPSATEM